jgi:hypothetical protein
VYDPILALRGSVLVGRMTALGAGVLVSFELAPKLTRVFAGQVIHHLYDMVSLSVRALDAQDARLILSAWCEGNKHAGQSCDMPATIVCWLPTCAPDSLWTARILRKFGRVLFHKTRPISAHAVVANIFVNSLDALMSAESGSHIGWQAV